MKTNIEKRFWDRVSGTYIPDKDIIGTKSTQTSNTKSNYTKFLKGPIPWDWVIRASDLPGKALIIGLCLWRLSGATKKNEITLGNKEIEPFGINRAAKSRAIAALKQAGLIEVERNPGRWSTIKLLT